LSAEVDNSVLEREFSRERRVFEACLERTPAGREAFLAEACGGDVAFRLRMERLLEAHARDDATLLPSLGRAADLEMPHQIGPYVIVRVLGEGGMGLVYEAEQSEPLARRVALKVIRAGLDSHEVVARFEAERQALAVMDHPNIARVFDAGITESGRPYFVMELVRGVPLLDYCDRHRLTIRERLALFVPLCLAVHHAHQKGIIHRDLKPANVLVLERDGRPIPKVIDFGVAKAVGHALTARPAVTLHGQLVGTPAYMSPEQADTSGLDVDTRSDVYSLGVMLYELLLGALPVDPQEIGVREFLSRLANLETDPPLPSDFLARHLDLRRSAAAKRKADPERLAEELRGDLDSIILKAMEKNRAFRYASANDLALDIGRHLRNEPVLARPPTATYRLRKFVRRHRVGVVAAAAVVLALSVGASAMTVGLFRATMAERVARAEAARAHEMELQANQRLRDSLLAQARATRNSRSSGRRHLTLSLLRQAAAIRPGSDLRDEAIAALMLTDLRPKAEWPLPDPDQHYVFEFAPRLDRYLLGFEDGRIEIHSVLGRSVKVLPATGLPVRVARFSSDGTKVAVKYHGASETGPAAFSVWNVDSGRKLLSYEGGIAKRAFDFSPDDRSIAYVTLDRKLIYRELVSGRILLRKVLESVPYAIKFRPDGAALAFALQNKSLLVIGLNGAERRRVECQAVPTSLDWDKEGRLLGAGFYDYSASIWDIETGRRTSTLQGHQAEVVAILFNPTAPIVATYSWDETSRLWELATGREILVVGAQVRGFSRDGRAASFLTRQAAGIWEVLHGDTFRILHGHSGKSPVSLQFGTDASRIIPSGSSTGTPGKARSPCSSALTRAESSPPVLTAQ
jgi:eukaryotic-like serine/threonine-protein kinase